MTRSRWGAPIPRVGAAGVVARVVDLARPAVGYAWQASDPPVAQALFATDGRPHALLHSDPDRLGALVAAIPPNALVITWSSGPAAGTWVDPKPRHVSCSLASGSCPTCGLHVK